MAIVQIEESLQKNETKMAIGNESASQKNPQIVLLWINILILRTYQI